jgi:integrase
MLTAIAPFTGHLCFVPARGGRPRSAKGAVTMMLKACAEAGIDATAHGLRKTRAASIIEHGGTSSQSAAWTGHQSLKLAQHYQREFDRKSAVMGA